MTVKDRLYTVDGFEAFIALPQNSDKLFELIDGEIVEKVPTEKHSMIVGNVYSAVREHTRPRNLGRIVFEVRYRMPDDQRNTRLPDISFTSAARLQPVVEKGAVEQMPDLMVEVQSPEDSIRKMREKADYYLQNGARMVWLIYPDKRLVEVYTPDDTQILTENETLTGGDVLPDFAMPLKDIFEL